MLLTKEAYIYWLPLWVTNKSHAPRTASLSPVVKVQNLRWGNGVPLRPMTLTTDCHSYVLLVKLDVTPRFGVMMKSN